LSPFARRSAPALLALAALLLPGLAALSVNLGAPNVKKMGRTVARYRDDVIQVVVGYKHAQYHLDSRWIVLEACISATTSQPVEIYREDVALLGPDGTRMPMPSQKKMAQGIPDLRRMLLQAQVIRDPIGGYFPGRLREERLGFFTMPGEGIVFDQVTVDHETLAWGHLFFESPNSRFEPGIYTLVMENKVAHVRIPLALGIAGDLERTR
jgi:hypothetical protein